ncbi:MAG: type IV toxin-antitoxin system AbiEi family antitoxin [Bacteroidota bacterium]
MNQAQLGLLMALKEYELDIFTLEEVKALFKTGFEKLSGLIENLVHKGLLARIERGKYCRTAFRDENVIGTKLIADGAVAYWSALNLHGFTDQFPNKIFIQSPHKKAGKSVFKVAYKFVTLEQSKIAGIITAGQGNHAFHMTDKEKTIVDCFDRPEYSGGYEELITAFTHEPLDTLKLIEYAGRLDNKAVIKRMGYLAELTQMAGAEKFISFARSQVNDTFTLIDPFGENSGEFIMDWKLRLNIPKENLLRIGGKDE